MGIYNKNIRNNNGISYSKEVDGPSDWINIESETYFKDLSDSLIYYKNSNDIVISIFEEAGITSADNGLNISTSDDIELGGTLNKDTDINGNNKTLNLGTLTDALNGININSITSTRTHTFPGFDSITSEYTPGNLTINSVSLSGDQTHQNTTTPFQYRREISDTSTNVTSYINLQDQLTFNSENTSTSQSSNLLFSTNQTSLSHSSGSGTSNVFTQTDSQTSLYYSGNTQNGIIITGDTINLYGPETNIDLNISGSTFTDNRVSGSTKGLEYGDDYHLGFTDRTLVDKAYVDYTIVNNITSSAGSGLTFNTTTNKIDLGGVLDFNDPGNPSNNIYFTPSTSGSIVRWGADSLGNLPTNSSGAAHYISRFDYVAKLGEYKIFGSSGDSGVNIGVYESQSDNLYIKQYKDVSQITIQSLPGINSSMTFLESDGPNIWNRTIWESHDSNTRSYTKQTFDKFEWSVYNNTGNVDATGNTFIYIESERILMGAAKSDGTKFGIFQFASTGFTLVDGDFRGVGTLPTAVYLGNLGGSNLIIEDSNDSTFTDGTTNKRGLKYIGFGETDTETGVDADYTTLVGTSLVPKKYVDDSILDVNTIYNTDDSLTDDRVVDLNGNSLTFSSPSAEYMKITTSGAMIFDDVTSFRIGNPLPIGTEDISLRGTTSIKGQGITGNSAFSIYNNATTPIKKFDFLDNGKVQFLSLPTSSSGLGANDLWNNNGDVRIGTSAPIVEISIYTTDDSLTDDRVVDLLTHTLTLDGTGETGNSSLKILGGNQHNALEVRGNSDSDFFELYSSNLGSGKMKLFGEARFGFQSGGDQGFIIKNNANQMEWRNSSGMKHEIRLSGGGTGVFFHRNGVDKFIVGGTAPIESEKISLQEDTLISGKLELSTKTDGILLPRLDTNEMDSISSPDTHLVIFNTDLNALYRYNGTAWVAMSAGYGLIEVKDSSGNPTFYSDLQAAIDITSSTDTVKIHSEIQLTSTVNIPGRTSLTIDFQGNRIYGDTSGGDFNLFTITQSNGNNRRDLQFIGGGVLETIGTVTASGSAMPFSALNVGSDDLKLYAGETQIRSVNGDCFYTNGIDLIKGGIFYSENAGGSFGGTATVLEHASVDVYNRPTFGFIVRYCKLITRFGGFFVSQSSKIHNCFIKGPVTQTGTHGLLYIHRGTECYDNYLEQTDTSASGRDALYIRGSSPNATGIDGRVSGNTCINRGSGAAGMLVYGSVHDNYFFSENGYGLYIGGNCKTVSNNKCFTNAVSGKQAIHSLAEETIKNYAENVNSSNSEPSLIISSASGQTHEAHGNTAIVANNTTSNIKLFGPGALYVSNNIMGLLGTGLDLNGNINSQINTTDAHGNLKIG
tara:strand:- start:8069 stop:12121 length:4053 start_codon:yes stop_codon:yes gene_type:complete